jgi:hypothetical protein
VRREETLTLYHFRIVSSSRQRATKNATKAIQQQEVKIKILGRLGTFFPVINISQSGVRISNSFREKERLRKSHIALPVEPVPGG